MQEMLLINPSHRPKRRARKAASPAQRRARAAFAAAARARRKNPARRVRRAVPRAAAHRVVRRRRNPIHTLARRTHRRRRNPISMGGAGRGIVAQLKHALIGGAGAVGVDVIMGQLNKYLPASMQTNPNTIGLGDAVKAVATVVLGQVLSKPTRGLSRQLAAGALTVQAADILRSFVPASMTVGYYSTAKIMSGSPRIGPNTQSIAPGMGRYMLPGTRSPALNRFMAPGGNPVVLNGRTNMLATGNRHTNVRAR